MSKKIGTITGLEWALKTITGDSIQPDEFTVRQIMTATGKTHDSVWHRLNRAKDRGELTSRTGTVDGHMVTIYKRAI